MGRVILKMYAMISEVLMIYRGGARIELLQALRNFEDIRGDWDKNKKGQVSGRVEYHQVHIACGRGRRWGC